MARSPSGTFSYQWLATVTLSYTDGLGTQEGVTSKATVPVKGGTPPATFSKGTVGNDKWNGTGGGDDRPACQTRVLS
jgi:hypothetical protein